MIGLKALRNSAKGGSSTVDYARVDRGGIAGVSAGPNMATAGPTASGRVHTGWVAKAKTDSG